MTNKYEAKASILAWELIDKLNDMTGETFDAYGFDRIGVKGKKGFRVSDASFRTSINVSGKTWEDVCDSAMAALATCEVISASINETKEG